MENKDILAYYTLDGKPCASVSQGNKDFFFELITEEEFNKEEDKNVSSSTHYNQSIEL